MKNSPAFFPAYLQLEGRPCLLVGGGLVATRKAERLLQAGAKLTVIAPEISAELQHLKKSKKIVHRAKKFTIADIKDKAIIIAATNDEKLNQKVSLAAKKQNIPVNVVDQPDLCTFIMPSVIERAPVTIAISTGGHAPILARLLRARLETLIPAAYGQLAKLLKDFRVRAKKKFPDTQTRRRFWERVLQGPAAEHLFSGHEETAKKILEDALHNEEMGDLAQGEVYLVGAGPGDPDLLTFRALRLMQQADVVLYDRLVHPQILDLVRREAKRIHVGKQRDRHTIPQEEINAELARLAKEGKRVLRLKGGDPFIFGRGGEEIDTLAAQNIPFQIVPGITAASGCAAYAGIPLTHRDYAHACVFVTGHIKDGKLDLNWDALIQPRQTLAIYMGIHGAETICRELIAHGMRENTPVALVQKGTTPEQRICIATLATTPESINKNDIKPPAMMIVGEVVRLHGKLSWFKA